MSGKTVVLAEADHTITGEHTFERAPSAPYVVEAGSAVVPNLDADMVDGVHAASLATLAGSETLTNKTLTSPVINTPTIAAPVVTGIATFAAAPAMAAGVQFPATQAASSDVNNLDDYEEGTWTPVIGGAGGQSGQTYQYQVGSYTKIGRRVLFQGYVVLTAKGTITGIVEISGLPFTPEGTLGVTFQYSVCPIWFNSLATTWVSVVGYVIPGTASVQIVGLQSAAASQTGLTTADIGNTTQFMVSGSYMATA